VVDGKRSPVVCRPAIGRIAGTLIFDEAPLPHPHAISSAKPRPGSPFQHALSPNTIEAVKNTGIRGHEAEPFTHNPT